MFNINKIEFKNFLSYGSVPQNIEFKPGINVVLGTDLDKDRSNGAGKSACLETIQYALYGQTHRGVIKEQLVNWKNRKNCSASILFNKNENNYVVTRGEKPSLFEIYKNGELIPKPSHVRDYQKLLEDDIIGLNFQTFISLLHTNINSSKPILEMSKPEKRKFVEKVFGLEIFSKLNDLCNKKIKGLLDRIRELEITISNNENNISETEKRIRELTSKISQMSSSKQLLEDKKSELDEKDDQELEDKMDKLSFKIDKIKSACTYYEHIVSKCKEKSLLLESKIKRLNKDIKDIEEVEKSEIEMRKRIKVLDDYKEKNGSIEDIESEIKEHENDIGMSQSFIESVTNDITELKSSLSAYLATLKGKKENVEKLKNGTCPTCGQDVSSNEIYKKIMNSVKEDIKNIKYLKMQIEQSELKKRTEKVTIEEINVKISSLRKKISYISSLEKNIYPLTAKDKKPILSKIKRFIAANTLLSGTHDHYYTSSIKFSNKLSLMNEEMKELLNIQLIIFHLGNEIKRLQEKVETEENTKKEFTSLINSDKVLIKNWKDKNKELYKKNTTYTNLIDHLNVIKSICEDKKIKAYIISSTIPYLNKRVNHYLSECNFGFYAMFDDFLDVDIKGPGVTKATYQSLSGGERRGIDLALQFSFLDIIRRRAKDFPDLLVMDEILDSSIDAQGLPKLMNIIRVKQREDNMKIFVVSHRDDISSESDIDYTYMVEKSAGYSKVREI